MIRGERLGTLARELYLNLDELERWIDLLDNDARKRIGPQYQCLLSDLRNVLTMLESRGAQIT